MTELETLERARMYIEKLANGINPLDDTVIPDEDVVNNVRLSRCFFYVANVLQQVINNGGVIPQKKPKKLSFALPLETRADFDFSSTPIPISEISRRLNILIDTKSMSRLSYRAIRDWLISVGLLEEATDENKKFAVRPTTQGEALDILLEHRISEKGPYVVVLYALEAQHFILDNLDAIIDFEHSKTENQGQPWSNEHDEYLADQYKKGVPIKVIASVLKRSNGAIRARLEKFNLLPYDDAIHTLPRQ